MDLLLLLETNEESDPSFLSYFAARGVVTTLLTILIWLEVVLDSKKESEIETKNKSWSIFELKVQIQYEERNLGPHLRV